MVRTSVFKRSAVLGTGAVLIGLLVGCSPGGAPSEEGDAASQAPQKPSGPAISAPKDATAVDRCSLLSAEAAQSLGLAPRGEERPDPLDPDAPAPCTWSDGGRARLSLTPINDRSLQAYYDNQSQYVDYAALNIAGHPAVRANQGDPRTDGACDIFLATQDGQVLAAQSHVNDVQDQDPCGLTQKALEASVPTLPAAK